MKRAIIGIGMVIALIGLVGCGGTSEEIQDGNSSKPAGILHGKVDSIKNRDIYTVVEEDVTGGKLENGTLIKVQTHRIDLGVFESIEEGDLLEIHYDGEIEQTNPLQIKADVILVLSQQ
ncbi:MAG TPA: hypothetical protein VIG63_02100 [Savagea sp.]